MKTVVLFAIAVALLAGPASAEDPFVGVFADPAGEDCYPRDIVPGVFQIHVVLKYMDCAKAVEFTIENGGGFEGVFLGESLAEDWIAFGSAASGKQIAFGGARYSPIHVLTLSYYCEGASEDCSYFQVGPFPESGLNYIDCEPVGSLLPARGGRVYVNGDDSCPCEAPGQTTAIHESTWGNIKAAYAE